MSSPGNTALTTTASPAAVPDSAHGGWGRYYLVLLISLMTASQIADRQMLSIVIEPIKREFALTDSQMGFVTGAVFSIAYAIGALPLAVLADRWSAKKIIAMSLACWSFFTTATMATTNYLTLVVTRFMVGLGEAGAGPASLSMIASRFPPEKRSGVIAILTAVSAVTAFAAFWGAGYVVEHFGWRRMFLIFGAPGILLAVIIWLTLMEQRPVESAARRTLSAAELRRVLTSAPMLHVFATCVWNGIIANGLANWTPSFLIRTYHMSMSRVGFWLGLAGMMSGGTGALLGGFVADARMKRDAFGGVAVALVVLCLYFPISMATFVVHSEALCLVSLVVSSVAVGMSSAPIAAQFLNLMPEKSRSTAMAVLSMGILLFSGLGAALVGLLSDFASARGSANGLRASLLAVAALGILPILHLRALLRYRPRNPGVQAGHIRA